jgi:predicted DNA binding CopG/RHH family protein
MANRVGRPARSGDKASDVRLQVRVTVEELATYDKAAEAAGVDRSTWIRELLNATASRSAIGRRRE